MVLPAKKVNRFKKVNEKGGDASLVKQPQENAE